MNVDLKSPPWSDLCSLGQEVHFKKDQTLAYHGHTPCGIFVILSGQVTLSYPDGEPSDAEDLVVTPQGQIVGLRSALNSTPFPCDVVAAADCRTVFISKTLIKSSLSKG